LVFEKRIYNRVIKFFLGKEKDKLAMFDKDIQALAQGYNLLGKQAAEVVEQGRDNEHILRKENQELRKEKAKLKADLEASMESMESMMAEYTNMYEGGSKDGEQRLKNEMHQLKQKLQHKGAGQDKLDPKELEETPSMVPDEAGK
jgi:predicted nuclease with TOPRIM domain